MIDVIDFFFQLLNSVWTLIVSQWLFASSFVLVVIGWVISLINGSSRDS